VRFSHGTREVTTAKSWSSIRDTIWRCWSRRLARWTRRRRWWDGVAPCFSELRRLLEARLNKGGVGSMCRCCGYGDLPVGGGRAGDRASLHLGTISFDAVKHLLLCRIEQRPHGWIWRTIRTCHWRRWDTQASEYMALLGG